MFDCTWLLGSDDECDFATAEQTEKIHCEVDEGRRPSPTPRRKVRSPKAKQTCHKRNGRPRVEDEFPGIIDTARAFVEANGFEAHRLRNTTTGNCGVTLDQIRCHLFESIPGLKERHSNLGLNTIHRWMKAPNKRNKAASSYQGVIDAKLAPKKNNKNTMRQDTHYCRARVKSALEMLGDLGETCAAISMDNKNKVHIGEKTLAVDRRLQPGRFFPSNDAPNYADHDFPTPGYLITPAGYLVMEPGKRQYYKDDKGRDHLRFSRSGTTYVVNRPPSMQTNIETHIVDVLPIVKELVARGRTAVFLLVDNGPDFNPRSSVNQHFFGSLWKEANLDAMGVISYAAADSKLNPIERVWGVLTKKLTGVYLTDVLPGETTAPRQQGLAPDALQAKEVAVFNQAMGLLDKYWDGLSYNTYPIHSTHVKAGDKVTSTLHSVQTAINSSKRQFQANPRVMENAYFTSAHLQRMDGVLIFTKCTSSSCLHCTSHPIQHHEACTAFKNFTTPAPSPAPDTYRTYLEMRDLNITPSPDAHMPSRQEKDLGRCTRCKRCYLFCSQADKTRHNRLFH